MNNMGVKGSQGKGHGKGRSTGLLCKRMEDRKNTLGWGILRGRSYAANRLVAVVALTAISISTKYLIL